MRFTLLSTLVAFGVVACGSEQKSTASQAQAATPAAGASAAAPAAAATPAAIVEVKMTGNGTSQAAFEPSKLTIKPGTTVRFINVSGGPHNVAFYGDSIPKGAADALKKGMPNPMGDLTGPFLTQPNEKYDVAFTGAPAGTYKGYCMPHVALGMHITITVQ
ncbi:MAG TPA: plastocyanin/azurin family copper-binding protein [Gemmatimonadales bacterium]|nr:plastocyanin/azurin family copper-binding protein [Gemmatimonadales bacterium]